MVTVKQMIESLSSLPLDAPVQICIKQYNKRFPVAYMEPSESSMVNGKYATLTDGVHARITCMLPYSAVSYTGIITRKTH